MDETYNVVNALVEFSQATYTVNEDGTASGMAVTLNRNTSSGTSTVRVTLSGGTATSGDDYGTTPVDITFNEGDTSKVVVLPLTDESLVEEDETVNLSLAALSGTGIGSQASAIATINDNDTATISIEDVSVSEGSAGGLVVTATLNGDVGPSVSFDFETVDGTALSATGDYTAIATTTRTFASTSSGSSELISVQVNDDFFFELDEDFVVRLSNISAGGADVRFAGDAGSSVEATVTIVNDDSVDFGDAPSAASDGRPGGYPTLAADGGALHSVDPTGLFRLGSLVDAERDGQPSADATGDDNDSGDNLEVSDDEDGILGLATIVRTDSDETRSSFEVVASLDGRAGLLHAWIDFNRDGDWDDAGEQIVTNEALVEGSSVITFTVPAGAGIGDTFARFRLSETSNIGPGGFGGEGEVEDYLVTLVDGTETPADAEVSPPPEIPETRLVLDNGEVVLRENTGDGTVLFSAPQETVDEFVVEGSDDADDTLTIDLRNGNPVPGGQLTFNGGVGGNDTLVIIDDNGTTVISGTYLPDLVNGGDGIHMLDLASGGTLTITFTGLEPTIVSGIPTYTFLSPASEDVITVGSITEAGGAQALTVTGTSDGLTFESLVLFDVANFTIDLGTNDTVGGGSGNDQLTIAGGVDSGVDLARGLNNFTIDLGTAGSGDTDSLLINSVVDVPGLVSIDGTTVTSSTTIGQDVLIGMDAILDPGTGTAQLQTGDLTPFSRSDTGN